MFLTFILPPSKVDYSLLSLQSIEQMIYEFLQLEIGTIVYLDKDVTYCDFFFPMNLFRIGEPFKLQIQ